MKFKKLSHVLIFCLAILLMFFVINRVLGFLENKFFPGVGVANPYLFMTINELITSFMGILILKKLGKLNILKDKGKGFGYGVMLGSIMMLPQMYDAFGQIRYVLGQEPELQPVSVIITIFCLFVTVGFYEELMYRGIILGVIDDYFGHKRSASGVWKTVILSGLFFGIFHLGNLTNVENFWPVLKQVIDAVGGGMFWGAVYMRCRNLYSLMFLHALNDILAAGVWLSIAGTSLWGSLSSSKVNFIGAFIWLIIHILLTMFLLRKKKMKEIINSCPDKLSAES